MQSLKHDSEKLRWDLLPLNLVENLVAVYTFGARKYAPNSWQNLPNGYDRYKAALFRHIVQYEKGETLAPESGLPHLAHAAWNALVLLHFTGQRPCYSPHNGEHLSRYQRGTRAILLSLMSRARLGKKMRLREPEENEGTQKPS